MSNTTQEFPAFVRMADAGPARSSRLVIVDGAPGGMDARARSDPARLNRPGAKEPWDVLDERLRLREDVLCEEVWSLEEHEHPTDCLLPISGIRHPHFHPAR
jgi:hypothetical protein